MIKNILKIVLSLSFFVVQAIAKAESSENTGLHISSTYHLAISQGHKELSNDLTYEQGDDEMTYSVKSARIIAKSQLNSKVSVFIRYSLLKSKLQRYHLTFSVTDKLSVLAGLQKARVFGWHRRLANGRFPIESRYIASNYRPFSDALMLEISHKSEFGKLTLQITEDFLNCESPANTLSCISHNRYDNWGNKSLSQPAFVSEWIGQWGNFQPLLQVATYDSGNNYTFSGGVRYANGSIDLHVDYVEDNRSNMLVSAEDNFEIKSKLKGFTFHGESALDGFRPFIHYSSFGITTNHNETLNNVGSIPYAGAFMGGETVGLGCYYEGVGSMARPYISFRYLDVDKKYTLAGDKDFYQGQVTIGLVGKI